VPLLITLGIALFVFVLTLASLPFMILLRYRQGTRRRRAYNWIISINLVAITISATTFLITAAVVNRWVPQAFLYSVAGFGSGWLLGLAGLGSTRWESEGRTLHYTPNRLLVLGISLVVTARLLYGFWRGWQTWQTNPDQTSWLASIGIAGSMAAGGVVLGYYLVYWTGVRWRLRKTIRGPYRGALRRM
jgi:hypothetical protein